MKNNFKKIKIFFKKNVLIIFSVLGMFIVVLFWIQVWTDFSEQKLDNKIIFNKAENDLLEQKINKTMENFSCEVRDEKIIKGYVRKIEENYFIISDGQRDLKIEIKPETLFVRVYVSGKDMISQEEINKKDIAVYQDVVAPVFLGNEKDAYSLLIKQIVNVN